MKYFRGKNKKKNYFEGWYFKQSTDDFNIAFIPSIIINKNKEKKALIQVITNNFSECFYYDYNEFFALQNRLFIKIKNNVFSEYGIMLNLENERYQIKAEILFQGFTKIKPIMGPFSSIPLMECYHDIISMHHVVNGYVNINENTYELTNAQGYIEKDAGRHFPSKYFWLQSNQFNKDINLSLSVAKIPFYGFNFLGLICSLIYNNEEFRFATYNFAKVIHLDKEKIILKKRKFTLELYYTQGLAYPLYAPLEGEMSRIIEEGLNGKVKIKLWLKNSLILESVSDNVAIEEMFIY